MGWPRLLIRRYLTAKETAVSDSVAGEPSLDVHSGPNRRLRRSRRSPTGNNALGRKPIRVVARLMVEIFIAACSWAPVTTNSQSTLLSSLLSGDFSSSSYYVVRRVDCRRSGAVIVKEVPWVTANAG
jgi:hypothetical protein